MASMHVRLASGEEVMTLSAEELLGWLLVTVRILIHVTKAGVYPKQDGFEPISP